MAVIKNLLGKTAIGSAVKDLTGDKKKRYSQREDQPRRKRQQASAGTKKTTTALNEGQGLG